MKLETLLLFLGATSATTFRPYVNGRTPWYKDVPRAPKDDHPVDYFVANFGQDKDINDSIAHTEQAESKLGHKWTTATFKKPKGHPVDYFVPDFGVDKDVLTTQRNLKDAEKSTGHVWAQASFKAPKGHPVDYFVPNFGVDKDVQSTLSSAQQSEKSLKHKWVIQDEKDKPKPPPMGYFVPNFGMDHDIADSLSHTKQAENRLGKWNPENLAMTESDLHLESDPVCSSAGCTQYKHAHKKPAYPVDYPVPNLGQDKEIKTNFNSLQKAEGIVHHHWNFGTKESKDKWHNVAKDTMYDYAPHLDNDVEVTQRNLANTEGRMGHKYQLS